MNLQEITPIIQAFIPVLMVRTDLGVNPVLLIMIVPLIKLLSVAYTYVESLFERQEASVFIHTKDFRVYQAIMHTITTKNINELSHISFMSQKYAESTCKYGYDMFNIREDDSKHQTKQWDGKKTINFTVKSGYNISIVNVDQKYNVIGDKNYVTQPAGLSIYSSNVNTITQFVDECVVDHDKWKKSQNENLHVIYTIKTKEDCVSLSSPTPIHSTKTMDNVFLSSSVLYRIKIPLDEFISPDSVEKYTKMGWSRKLGYILYGPPGTGKSSLVYAICDYVQRPLLIVNSTKIKDFIKIASTIKNKVILFDDIDCFDDIHRTNEFVTEATTVSKDESSSKDKTNVEKTSFNNSSFSELLAVLDGYNSENECIIIFTTNHYEKLDPALVRPGRIDHHIELCTTNPEAVRQMFKLAFGRDVLCDTKDLRTDYTMAHISNCIIRPHIDNPTEAVRLISQGKDDTVVYRC